MMEMDVQEEVPGLLAVTNLADVPDEYRGTPVEQLLVHHNFGTGEVPVEAPSLLVGMCMDSRVHLRIPPGFAFVLRTAGGNLQRLGFPVSFAIAAGGVRAVALIGHDDCAMTTLSERRETFISGLSETADCDPEIAEDYFEESSVSWGIDDAVDFVRSQVKQLRIEYPEVLVAPLFFRLADQMLFLIDEGGVTP